MAYLDYDGLKRYDTKIKGHIDSQISSASEALTGVILDTHATHTIYYGGSGWWDGGGFSNGLNRVLEYETETTYTANKHWICYPSVDFITADYHDGDIVLLIVGDTDLWSISSDYVDYVSGYYLSTHATFNPDNNEVIELLGAPPSAPGTYIYVLSQGKLRHVEGKTFTHMDAFTYSGDPCITLVDISTDLGDEASGYISGRHIEYANHNDSVYVGIAARDGSPNTIVRVETNQGTFAEMGNSYLTVDNNRRYCTSVSFDEITLTDRTSTHSSSYGYDVKLTPTGLLLGSDVYTSSINGLGVFFEYPSSDASLGGGGLRMYNYGGGTLDPHITLGYNGSWTQEIDMWAQDEECYISLSHKDDEGIRQGMAIIRPTDIYIEPATGSSYPAVSIQPSYIQTTAIKTYTSSTPNKNSLGTGSAGQVLRTNGSGSSYWGGLNYLAPTNNTSATSYYPIILTSGTGTGQTTSQIYKSTKVGVQPSTGTLMATHMASETFRGAWRFKGSDERFRLVVSNYKSGTSTFNPQYVYQIGEDSATSVQNGYYYFESWNEVCGIWKVNYGTMNSSGAFSGNTYSDYVIIGWSSARYYCHNFIGYDTTIDGIAQTVYRDLGFDFDNNGNGQYYFGLLGNALSLSSSSNYRTAVQLIKMADIVLP